MVQITNFDSRLWYLGKSEPIFWDLTHYEDPFLRLQICIDSKGHYSLYI